MSRRLIISDGTREREMQLVGRVVVGRDPTCEISHDHSLLSRRHAEFVTAGTDVTVRDLGSRNGVFVNGIKAAERSLSPGDVVQIGPLRALYVTDLVSVGITPEQIDAGRTAMLRSPTSAPARPAAAAAAAAAAEEEDDAVTRLMRPPGRSVAAPFADSDTEQTRYLGTPADDVDSGGTVVLAKAPSAIASAALPAPAARSATATDAMSTFVFVQLLTFAGVLLAAAAVPLLMWRREVQSITGAAGDAGSLGWLAIPGAVALAATYVVGAAINRRFAQAHTAKRNRT